MLDFSFLLRLNFAQFLSCSFTPNYPLPTMYGSYPTQPPQQQQQQQQQQQYGYQPQQPQYGYPPTASSYGGGGISGVSAGVTQQSLTMTASVVDNEPQQQPPTPIYVDTQHDDMIHDAQLDYYGTKLATGSSGTYCVCVFLTPPHVPTLTILILPCGLPLLSPSFHPHTSSLSFLHTILIYIIRSYNQSV